MLRYNEPVFRPPAEAYSAILQVTIGCSWNKCAFCEMYKSKQFKTRDLEELKREIEILSGIYAGTKKIFLGDGNAFVLSTSKLMAVLTELKKQFGRIQRISSYASAKDILLKSDAELADLRANGLKLLYVGIESGDDELLGLINKGETYQSTKEGILKAHAAGIDTSVMILTGLGGKKYSEQHALQSAKLINEINPRFLSTLNLSFPYGVSHYKERFPGEFTQLSVAGVLREMKMFIQELNLEGTIYRSDHVSNQLILKGVLSRDQGVLLQQIENALSNVPEGLFPSSPMQL